MRYLYISLSVLVLFIIFNNVKFWSKYKKIMPIGYYYKNFFAGLCSFFDGLTGTKVLRARKGSRTGDSVFAKLTEAQLQSGLASAYKAMTELGITYEDAYIKRSFDCENFAETAKCFFDLHVSNMVKVGEGIPSEVVSYTDTKRGGHGVWFVIVNDKHRYFDGYPINGTFKELDMDTNELLSMSPVSMG
jgi:hypothetical protein